MKELKEFVAEQKQPVKGSQVELQDGQKGKVFWYGENKYHTRYAQGFVAAAMLQSMGFGMRCGIKLESGQKVFVNAEDVKVI